MHSRWGLKMDLDGQVTWEQYQETTRARTEQDRLSAMTQELRNSGFSDQTSLKMASN